MATLTWQDGDVLSWGDLATSGATTIGRRSDANIAVANDTVSRLHFIIRPSRDGFLVENLSQSTDTRLKGTPIGAPAALSDGDVIEAGTVSFRFHDLARSAGHQEVACSHCHRGNGLERRECWYCGTSLVNAPTAGFTVARPWGRIVGPDEDVTLFNGQSAFLAGNGGLVAGNATEPGAPVIIASTSGAMVAEGAPGDPLVNGRAGGEPITHGSTIQVAGLSYLFVGPG